MDVVKLEDINIRVKTLTINGKKITKSIFDQIPFGIFMFYRNEKLINHFDVAYYDVIGYRTDSIVNGKFVAYLNKDVRKSNDIRGILRFYNFVCSTPEGSSEIYYPMLYLDKYEKLKRSYISESDIRALKLIENQIYI